MLRVLDALAKAQNVTNVGKQLGLTQSGVSHALRGLKEALGADVVSRTGRAVMLTEIGERAAVEARVALSAIDRVCQLGDRVEIKGKIRLAVVPSAAFAILPGAVVHLRRRHPAIEVELLEGSDEEVRQWFQDGLSDVAIGMERNAGDAEILARDELVLVVHRQHPLAMKGAVDFKQLAGMPFIMSAGGCEPLLQSLAGKNGMALNIVTRVRDVRSLLAMVRDEVGVSILPAMSISNAETAIATVSLKPKISRELWLMCGPSSPLQNALIDALRGHAPQM